MTLAALQVLQIAVLLGVAAGAWATVRTRDPVPQAIGLGFYGLLLAVMFLAFRAPDVALSQIVIGAVALPLMISLTLAKMKRDRETAERSGEPPPPRRAVESESTTT